MMNHVSRRKFLKGSAITAAATTGTLAAPVVARAEPAVEFGRENKPDAGCCPPRRS